MATPTALVASAYTQVAADVTALDLIHCPHKPAGSGVELIVAASLPAVTDRGIVLAAGETMEQPNIAYLGASGKLYAKPAFGRTFGEILTL